MLFKYSVNDNFFQRFYASITLSPPNIMIGSLLIILIITIMYDCNRFKVYSFIYRRGIIFCDRVTMLLKLVLATIRIIGQLI